MVSLLFNFFQRTVLYACVAVVAAATLLGWGYWRFTAQLPTPAQVPQAPLMVSGAVVFTGGEHRVQQARDLLEQGFTGPILITGVGAGATLTDLLGPLTPPQAAQVTLDYRAQTTWENVRETVQWARGHQVDGIYLITAFYHMPRAQLLWADAAPEIQAVAWPVFPAGVTRLLLFNEYLKYLGAQVGLG